MSIKMYFKASARRGNNVLWIFLMIVYYFLLVDRKCD